MNEAEKGYSVGPRKALGSNVVRLRQYMSYYRIESGLFSLTILLIFHLLIYLSK